MFSYEGGGAEARLTLATSGIGAAYLTVQGKTSHAGARPEGGINALYELAHQCCRWTSCRSPKRLEAELDHRPGRHQPQRHGPGHGPRCAWPISTLARTLEEKSRNKLLPESKVSVKFEVRRPPLEATAASRAGLTAWPSTRSWACP